MTTFPFLNPSALVLFLFLILCTQHLHHGTKNTIIFTENIFKGRQIVVGSSERESFKQHHVRHLFELKRA